MKRGQTKMCIVNPALVEDIAPLTGSQSEIMRRIGISWNSWIKISGGLPIRLSVGRRLKDRILQHAHEVDALCRKFPAKAGTRGIDEVALDAAFLRMAAPSQHEMRRLPPLRSVRRARQLLVVRSQTIERTAAALP